MLDDRVGAGRAGFVAQASCQRCVSHSSCSRPFVGCHRMRTCVHYKPRNHGRTTRQRMSRHAFGSAFTSIQNSSLSPRRRTRLLPINRCPRTPAGGMEYGANGRLGQNGAWGGREPGAEASLGRKRAWGGSEPGAEGSVGLKRGWGGREYGAKGSMGRTGVWGGSKAGVEANLGQKGVWGARHTPTHHPPLAPSSYDISQPAGRHLPYFWKDKFMLPKRRFWKEEQKMQSGFSNHFFNGSWPKLSTHALEKYFENPDCIFCSPFQNLRLGGIKFFVALFCSRMLDC
jgi:hypothetical protein